MRGRTTYSKDAEFRNFPHLWKASSGEAFHNIRRSLPISGKAAPQTQVRKNAPKGSVIFKDVYCMSP